MSVQNLMVRLKRVSRHQASPWCFGYIALWESQPVDIGLTKCWVEKDHEISTATNLKMQHAVNDEREAKSPFFLRPVHFWSVSKVMKIGCVYTESHFLCCWWAFCLDKCGIAWNRGEKREVRLRIQTRICTQHDSACILEYGSQVRWNRCLYRTVSFWKRLIIIRVRIVLAISCERETY